VESAGVWVLGGGAAATAAVGVKHVICRDGTVLDYTDDQITFTKTDGRTWGPYDRT
jgi:hypothetical protein